MEQTEESGYRSADEFLIFARRSNYRFSGGNGTVFPPVKSYRFSNAALNGSLDAARIISWSGEFM